MKIRLNQNELLDILAKSMNVNLEGIEILMWKYSGEKGKYVDTMRIEKISEESLRELKGA